MSRFFVAALLCLAVAASLTGVSSASTSSAGCAYKFAGFPMYLKVTGIGGMCDVVGQGAGGSLVRIYSNVVGSSRCAFQKTGTMLTLYSSSSTYGSVGCASFSKSLGNRGWTRVY